MESHCVYCDVQTIFLNIYFILGLKNVNASTGLFVILLLWTEYGGFCLP
jgi:hypothetical protein